MASDYIPRNAAKFDLFVQNLLGDVKNMQSNSKPWAIIPQEPIDYMYRLHAVFSQALLRAKNTPAPAYTKERNRTQAELTKAIRAFLNQFMRFEPVTDLDRDKMWIPSRTPFIIDFEENERGQTVWVALCWQNGRSIRGKWSAFKSTIVP